MLDVLIYKVAKSGIRFLCICPYYRYGQRHYIFGFSARLCMHIYMPSCLCKELKERLGIDDIALVLQQNRLRWYGHVLRKGDDDWAKKCMEYKV